MSVAICIPWRSAPKREPLLRAVLDTLLGFSVYFGESDPGEFSRSQAANRAVGQALDAGHDVVVVNDADTISTRRSLLTAIELTREDGEPRLPYDEYVLMDQAQTDLYSVTGLLPNGPTYDNACSGVLVFRADSWREIGGFDERYRGWGHEDSDMGVRAQFARVPGRVWSLWHEPDDRSVSNPRNLKIFNDTHH